MVDLVLKNARIVNVFTNEIEEADIAVSDGIITGIGTYEGAEEIDLEHAYVCPGFLDGHIHLESSMVAPSEFEKMVLPHGTTCVITDPHEIANVAGLAGIDYMLNSTENLDLQVYFMLPSCVPATPLDEAGATLLAEDLEPYFANPRVLGLAEVMNSYGVVARVPEVLAKLEAAKCAGKRIDGHAPFLSGEALNAYVAAGVSSDHECSDINEALEKMRRGQWIMIREGTAARNLHALMPLFDEPYYTRAMLVTDDKHPGNLMECGHMDYIIRRAVLAGANPVHAIRMATLHTAQYFGLSHMGAVAPGYQADLVVFDNFTDWNIQKVFIKGQLVAEDGRSLSHHDCLRDEKIFHSFHIKLVEEKDFIVKGEGDSYRIIDLVSGELLTKERIHPWVELPGVASGVNLEADIVKLAVFERHFNTGHAGVGFLGNYGLKKGAVASSIAHDSHNLIVAGTNDRDMAVAANALIKAGGGLALALNGEVVDVLPLPIAGLMSDFSAKETAEKVESMKHILAEWGIKEGVDGFMTLAFVSLPVIPSVRLNTFGLIDVNNQQIVPVRIDKKLTKN